MTRRLDFLLLGPLEVRDGPRSLPLGGRKQRSLLALLLLHANEVVSSDALIDGLWGERAPKTARTALQVYVSQLRKLLSAERLETRKPGYVLHVHSEELDLGRFEALCAKAREDGPVASATALGEALSLWRGPALSDFAYESFAQGEIARLEELRLSALEERIEAELDLGRHAEVVGELDSLVAEHPLRERLREQLILALYRSGRQAEALQAYRQARKALVEEHGLEPGSSLKELEKAILAQDVGLALSATVEQAPTNLPSPLTPLIGRKRELSEVIELASEARLVTLTGPGGSGKTRLALHAAAELVGHFPDGIWWVPLAALRDPELLEPTIAQVVGAKDGLAEHLRGKQALLVLDNFEQLVEASPRLSELLEHAPELRLLVTSRERLHLRGEGEYPVPPLQNDEAVSLFSYFAGSVRPGFQPDEHVAEICLRLEGMPLAIELAAARIKILEPSALLERLERPLPLLTGGARDAPERQRTLEATIAWSHDLLRPQEQVLFRRLAVFAGGFALEAAEELCEADLDTLQSLVDQSLVSYRDERFAMLETIREFAREQINQSGDADQIGERHATYFLRQADAHGDPFDRQEEDFRWWDEERENVFAAAAWARETGAEELELRLLLAAASYLDLRGVYDYGARIESLLESLPEAPQEVRAQGLLWCASSSWHRGGSDSDRDFAREALDLARSSGSHDLVVQSLMYLAMGADHSGRQDLAKVYIEEAEGVAREHETSDHWVHVIGSDLGNLALAHHDYAEARARFERSLTVARRRNVPYAVASNLVDLGTTALSQDEFEQAVGWLSESLALCESLGFRELLSWVFEGVAAISVSRGDATRGAHLLGASNAIQETAGMDGSYYPAALELRERTTRAAKELIGEADFTNAWLAGKDLGLDEATALAKSALD